MTWNENNREGRLPAFLECAGRHTREKHRIDFDVPLVARLAIIAREQRSLAAGVENVRILGIRRDITTFAAARRIHWPPEKLAARSTRASGRRSAGDTD